MTLEFLPKMFVLMTSVVNLLFKNTTALVLLSLLWACKDGQTTLRRLDGHALGTIYSVQWGSKKIEETQVQKKVDSLFYVLNKSMSTYLPDSDISKINRGDSLLIVDRHFKNVFQKATEVWNATDGYFDPTVGIFNAYGFGSGKGLKNISEKQKDSLLLLTGWEMVHLTPKRTVKKRFSSIFIDFNALAKGYAVDVIGNCLRDLGISSYLVEIGGEIVARGNNPKTKAPWIIAIENPKEDAKDMFIGKLSLKDKAIATSGNYRKFNIDLETGIRYVHIINPKTGSAKRSSILSASVIASDCMTADAWATALMILPLERSVALVEGNPELEARWNIGNDEGSIESVFSSGWEKNSIR